VRAVLSSLKPYVRLARSALASSPVSCDPSLRRKSLYLGATLIHLDLTQQATGGLTFVNLHENEQTSVQAAKALLAREPGRLIELHAGGRRLVTFRIGLRAYTVDPNRIFTDPGLAATLQSLGQDSDDARTAVRGLRDAVLGLLPPPNGRPVVALHNNAGADYSMEQYRRGGSCAGDAAQVHESGSMTDNEFFVVTDRELFEPLAAEDFNVVLQSESAFDDGSLSIWAGQVGRRYINVEAREGRSAQQARMLDAVVRCFGSP